MSEELSNIGARFKDTVRREAKDFNFAGVIVNGALSENNKRYVYFINIITRGAIDDSKSICFYSTNIGYFLSEDADDNLLTYIARSVLSKENESAAIAELKAERERA